MIARRFFQQYFFVLRDQWHHLLLIAGFFLLQSSLELLGVGLVGPFIGAVVNPEQLARYGIVQRGLEGVAGGEIHLQLTLLGIIILMIFVTKGFVAYRVQRRIFSFSFGFRAHLMGKLMGAYLQMPYQFYLDRNSFSLIQSVTRHTKVMADDMLIPSLRLVSDSFVLLVLGTFLFLVNPLAMLIFTGMLLAVFALYIGVVRPHVKAAGEEAAKTNEHVIRGVGQGIGGIKEIRILGIEQPFYQTVTEAAKAGAAAEAGFYSLLVAPRYLMETTVISFVILFSILVLHSGNNSASLVTVLAMFGAAGIRVLPAMTQVSASLASMNYSAFALNEVYTDLVAVADCAPWQSHTHALNGNPADTPKKFESLRLENATFSYPGMDRPAVDDVTLEIRKGSSVGLVGESGAGKTTLLDILLGLHPLEKGRLLFNGVEISGEELNSWTAQVAYIPQAVFLTDDTIERNIAIGAGREQIDRKQVMAAIELAQLKDMVEHLPDGIQTILGERGIRLSGGERQRIALARAFYHNRSVFVFDEATSALDNETEREIIKVIESLRGSKTLLVVAHRLTTVQGCDVVYRMQDGRLIASGKLEEVMHAV